MTSAEHLERATRYLAAQPVSRWLNAATGDSHLAYRLAFAERHIGNPAIRALHGGVISAFLDLAMQAAYAAETGAEGVCKSATFSIDFLTSSRADDMRADVRFNRIGRRIAFIEASGFQGDSDRPVAIARAVIRAG